MRVVENVEVCRPCAEKLKAAIASAELRGRKVELVGYAVGGLVFLFCAAWGTYQLLSEKKYEPCPP